MRWHSLRSAGERFQISLRLVGALSDADRATDNLAGEGRALPNPHLLIRPFVRREALLSSRVEGTRATLGEPHPSLPYRTGIGPNFLRLRGS